MTTRQQINVDVITHSIKNSLNAYYNVLSKVGYIEESVTNALLYMTFIKHLLTDTNYFSAINGIVNQEFFNVISDSLYKLEATNCIITMKGQCCNGASNTTSSTSTRPTEPSTRPHTVGVIALQNSLNFQNTTIIQSNSEGKILYKHKNETTSIYTQGNIEGSGLDGTIIVVNDSKKEKNILYNNTNYTIKPFNNISIKETLPTVIKLEMSTSSTTSTTTSSSTTSTIPPKPKTYLIFQSIVNTPYNVQLGVLKNGQWVTYNVKVENKSLLTAIEFDNTEDTNISIKILGITFLSTYHIAESVDIKNNNSVSNVSLNTTIYLRKEFTYVVTPVITVKSYDEAVLLLSSNVDLNSVKVESEDVVYNNVNLEANKQQKLIL